MATVIYVVSILLILSIASLLIPNKVTSLYVIFIFLMSLFFMFVPLYPYESNLNKLEFKVQTNKYYKSVKLENNEEIISDNIMIFNGKIIGCYEIENKNIFKNTISRNRYLLIKIGNEYHISVNPISKNKEEFRKLMFNSKNEMIKFLNEKIMGETYGYGIK